MSPLDARTPRELFGDAVDDPRALKRAYARLVKEHGPETAPEAFQHIRRLYEEAQEGESTATPAAPAETQGEDTWTSLALLDAHGLDGALDVLRTRAARGEAAAVGALVGITAAVRPEQLAAELRALVAQPASAAHAAAAAGLLWQLESAWGECEALADLVDACVAPEAAADLANWWIQLAFAHRRPVDAWAAWRQWEALIHRHRPAVWAPLLTDLLAGWSAACPEPERAAWLARASASGSTVPDNVLVWVRGRVEVRELLDQGAVARPADAALLDALRGLPESSAVASMTALAALAGLPGVRRRHAQWVREAPELAVVLEAAVENATRRRAILWAIFDGQQVDVVAPSPANLLPKVREELVLARTRAEFEEAQAREARDANRRRGWIVIALLLLGFAVLSAIGALVGARAQDAGVRAGSGAYVPIFLVLFYVLRYYVASSGKAAPRPTLPDPVRDLAPAPERSPATTAWCHEHGLFLHEAAVALGAQGRVVDHQLADPLSDLDVLGVAHVRRTLRWGGP